MHQTPPDPLAGFKGAIPLRGERGGDGRGKGWEEGGKEGEGKGKGERREGRGKGGTCSKVLGGIDAPAPTSGVALGWAGRAVGPCGLDPEFQAENFFARVRNFNRFADFALWMARKCVRRPGSGRTRCGAIALISVYNLRNV